MEHLDLIIHKDATKSIDVWLRDVTTLSTMGVAALDVSPWPSPCLYRPFRVLEAVEDVPVHSRLI